jgi:hypothetical protein
MILLQKIKRFPAYIFFSGVHTTGGTQHQSVFISLIKYNFRVTNVQDYEDLHCITQKTALGAE